MNDTADKLAIRDVLSRYCRGLDRMDKTMARSVFSADAPAHYYDMYQGTGHGFVDWAWEIHAGMERHSHQISNVLIDLDGDSARSESYVTVALWLRKGNDIVEIVCRGRYLDHWQKRDQQWLIVERKHVLDMQSTNGIPDADAPNKESARDESDPSFEIFAKA
jgi:hypothetical protein